MLFDLLLGFIFIGLPFGIAGGVMWAYDHLMSKPPAPRMERKPATRVRIYDWQVDGL